MSTGRDISWEGFFNARDLGGLPTRNGRCTRYGALIRSGDLRFVTSAGWQAARDAGVHTVLDLRNTDEIRSDDQRLTELGGSAQFAPAAGGPVTPSGMDRVEVPLDDIEDTEFWQHVNSERLNGTPLYYPLFLARKADRCAAVVTAIARAAPGGVLFHCGAGRDRTGLVALLLLALVDVEPEAIADDYLLTAEPLKAMLAAMGRADQGPIIEQALADRGTTARNAVLTTLDSLDAESYLLTAGVTQADLAGVRGRLLT